MQRKNYNQQSAKEKIYITGITHNKQKALFSLGSLSNSVKVKDWTISNCNDY